MTTAEKKDNNNNANANNTKKKSNDELAPVYESTPVDVAWNTRDVLLFANSIGCEKEQLWYLYENHPHFTPFPTYPIVLTFKHTHTSTIPFAQHFDTFLNPAIPDYPHFDSTRVVDGGRTLHVHHPIPSTSPSTATFTITSRILSITDKGPKKPAIVVIEHRLESAGTLYATVTETTIYLGQGGFGGPTGAPRLPPIPVVPPMGRDAGGVDAVLEHRIPETAHLLYRLNGDYNPLHADPAAGVNAGFKGEIMHGLYTWNSVARAVLRRFGGDGEEGLGVGELVIFEARFVAPTRPGDALRTECWVTKDGREREVVFRTWVKEGGVGEEKLCLNGGRAVIKVNGKVKGKL
ncbi:Thioesterase/thiol ester dehydrase-isomerase [Ascodesmis nigricans]|uniref:Thioesterase/thiol ester dehydrase-isomerase n=1 Tax=Ascodesmis nigricans TaxID=341454 RepID=A0A4S2MYF4_9PEZI|nr:Thioesterase/thiol ester dehydrase-isomerase [Ascodesmis nigricans]